MRNAGADEEPRSGGAADTVRDPRGESRRVASAQHNKRCFLVISHPSVRLNFIISPSAGVELCCSVDKPSFGDLYTSNVEPLSLSAPPTIKHRDEEIL